MAANGFEVRRLSGSVGAEILGVDLAAEPGHNVIAAIRKVWLDHGVIFFRDQELPPAKFLSFAKQLGQPVEYPFVKGIVVHRGTRPVLALDIDIWQTQGDALDRVQMTLDPGRPPRRPMLDGRPVKILHSTSPSMRQLFIGMAAFSVADLMLYASFKLLRPKPLL